jgi:hypothetical protein
MVTRKRPDRPSVGAAKVVRSEVVERVQTGVRMEKRMLKVLKGLAELKDLTLGDLLEGIMLHVFEGKVPFSAATLKQIAELKRLYGLELGSSASHRLKERFNES